MSDRLRAAACLTGVLAVSVAWAVGGLATEGFDPVRQSISQLQREGTPTGAFLTTAFAAFAVGGFALSPLLPRLPRIALLLVSTATLGAALSPLGEVRGGLQDQVHLAFGATGYLSLAVLPLLASRHLRGWWRAASLAAGAVTSACLLGTVPAEAVSGALQRAGFGVAHLWLGTFALAVLLDRPPRWDDERRGPRAPGRAPGRRPGGRSASRAGRAG